MRANRMTFVPFLSLFVFSALAVLPAAGATADSPRVLRIASFGGDAVLPGEATALQNLATSYVMELKMFRVIDTAGQELALHEAETAIQLGDHKELSPLSADYILSASANKAGGLIIFTMDVTKVGTGEKKTVSDSFSSVNDLILSVKRLTRSLFERQDAQTAQSQSSPDVDVSRQAHGVNPAPSLAIAAGTWKGDKSIDRVTLLPDGRGYAVLSSGKRMELKAKIEGQNLVIVQNQPNSPDFYRPSLDLKAARIVAQGARPWRWVLSLSLDGKSLQGVKESVFVTVDAKGAVTLDNNYVREALWTRLYR
jgi:hypothetical protein